MLPYRAVLIPNLSSLSYTKLPLQAAIKCLIQRLVPPEFMPSMVIMLPMVLVHSLNVFISTASIYPHFWPSNSLFLVTPSVSLLCGFLCLILNISIFSGLCSGTPFSLPNVLTPRSSHSSLASITIYVLKTSALVSQDQISP